MYDDEGIVGDVSIEENLDKLFTFLGKMWLARSSTTTISHMSRKTGMMEEMLVMLLLY